MEGSRINLPFIDAARTAVQCRAVFVGGVVLSQNIGELVVVASGVAAQMLDVACHHAHTL